MTLRATGTGIMVNRAVTSKDTKVLSRDTFCSCRGLANPLLSLSKRNWCHSTVEEFWLGIWLICDQMCHMLIL